MVSALRILQINTADQGGGAEGSAWNLFKSYQTRGHSSWLAVGRKHSTDPNVFAIPKIQKHTRWNHFLWFFYERLKPYEKQVPGVKNLRAAMSILADPRRRIEKEIGIEDFYFPGTSCLLNMLPRKPDIVHCHNLHGNYFDLRKLPLLSHQVPTILNLRDMWLLTGHCAYPIGCKRWKTGCGQCPDLSLYPSIKRDATAYNWRRKRDIFERSRLYVTAPSQWMMDQIQEANINGTQYRVIPNAIDLTVFQPESQAKARKSLGLPIHAKIVLLTAQSMFKDYGTMEAALNRLKLDAGVESIFICLGKKSAGKRVGQGFMVFPGFERNPKRMAQYYCAADVFIHAAKDEVFGKTVVEALACGVPVVATDVGGISEQIVHGQTGFLVPASDDVTMSAYVRRLLEDERLCLTMGRAGTEFVSQRYALSQQVDAFLTWYQEIREDWGRTR